MLHHNLIKRAISISILSLSLTAVAEPTLHIGPHSTLNYNMNPYQGIEAASCHITPTSATNPNPNLTFTGIRTGKTKNVLTVNGVQHVYGADQQVAVHSTPIDYMCFSAGSHTNITNNTNSAVTISCDDAGFVSVCLLTTK